jgi:hypothetical protein
MGYGENALASAFPGHSRPVDPARLDAAAIFLQPFGPRNSPKPPSLLHAKNGLFFTAAEPLHAAHALQAPFVGDEPLTVGVGVYRLGIRRRVPSFYLWGVRSKREAAAGAP